MLSSSPCFNLQDTSSAVIAPIYAADLLFAVIVLPVSDDGKLVSLLNSIIIIQVLKAETH